MKDYVRQNKISGISELIFQIYLKNIGNNYMKKKLVDKKYLIPKKFTKGDPVETSETPAFMSIQDYINAKANEERKFAHNYSLTRTQSDIPIVSNPLTEQEFKRQQTLKIAQLEHELHNTPVERKGLAQWKLDTEKAKVYEPYITGWDCVYTSTGNYSQRGINRRCSGNLTFASNPQKYGFVPITKDQLRPRRFSTKSN